MRSFFSLSPPSLSIEVENDATQVVWSDSGNEMRSDFHPSIVTSYSANRRPVTTVFTSSTPSWSPLLEFEALLRVQRKLNWSRGILSFLTAAIVVIPGFCEAPTTFAPNCEMEILGATGEEISVKRKDQQWGIRTSTLQTFQFVRDKTKTLRRCNIFVVIPRNGKVCYSWKIDSSWHRSQEYVYWFGGWVATSEIEKLERMLPFYETIAEIVQKISIVNAETF